MLRAKDWKAGLGRWLAFGTVATMGGVLALAQVAAPPGTGTPAPKTKTRSEAEAGQPPAPAARPVTDPQAQPRVTTPVQPRRPAEDTVSPEGQPLRRSGFGMEFNAQAQDGLVLSNVQANSVAAQAGLRAGDRLVSIDGRSFRSPRQLQAYLSGQFGRRVPVIYERGGQQYSAAFSVRQPEGDIAWLGVFLQDNETGQAGARVNQVYPAGPAARAGLRAGDVIQQMNKQPVEGSAELIGMVEEQKPGAKAELAVLRGEQQVPINVILGSRNNFVSYRGSENEEFQNDQVGEDEYGNIPPHAMQLEHDRRMAEQHQRIEEELRKLQEEVRKLREALQPRN